MEAESGAASSPVSSAEPEKSGDQQTFEAALLHDAASIGYFYYFFVHMEFCFVFFIREQTAAGRRSDPDTEQMAADQFNDKVIIFCFLLMSERCILSEHVRPRTTYTQKKMQIV